MGAFDCLGDPIRRRILGLRIDDKPAVDELGAVVQDEARISPRSVATGSSQCLPRRRDG